MPHFMLAAFDIEYLDKFVNWSLQIVMFYLFIFVYGEIILKR